MIRNSLEDEPIKSIPIFVFWNSLFQIVLVSQILYIFYGYFRQNHIYRNAWTWNFFFVESELQRVKLTPYTIMKICIAYNS